LVQRIVQYFNVFGKIIMRMFMLSAAKLKVYCLLTKSEPTGGFNLKSNYSNSMNNEKFILQLKLEPTGILNWRNSQFIVKINYNIVIF
jgi:hypothetical protein